MNIQSLWKATTQTTNYPPLQENINVDTAIIGAGITGITTARLLANHDQKIAIVEAHKVGGGTSGHSTGNLYITVDQLLSSVRSKYPLQTVNQIVAARTFALRTIESNIHHYNIDCDFKTCDWHLYSSERQSSDKIAREIEVLHEAGLPAEAITNISQPFPIDKAIRLQGQAQFHPLRYVQQLAASLPAERCAIYESTTAHTIEDKDGYSIIHTQNGSITAKNLVHATHTPKGVMLVQTLLGPYREYGIACKLEGNAPGEGIFWGYHGDDQMVSTRLYERDGEILLIVVGEPHKVGQAKNNEEHINNLEKFARRYFKVTETVYRWGGQHYRPADMLPYIGKIDEEQNIYIATGYSTDGLVYGTLASAIITDSILGTTSPWAELLKPTRKQPLKAGKQFIKENANVFKEYLKKAPGVADAKDYASIAPGEGKIIEKGHHKLAVYRAKDGQLSVHSAVCTHLSCIVNWNNAENSWDCPCHGSRFRTDGTVIEGPALHALHEVKT